MPLHWTGLIWRRYNQVALLSASLARRLNLPHCADLLVRRTHTQPFEGCGKDTCFAILEAVICCNPRPVDRWVGRSVLVVVDVMTAGATLTAATKALQNAVNYDVYATVLARADKRL